MDAFALRPATVADVAILARHRVGMFRDMGSVVPASEEPLHRTSEAYFCAALPAGEYLAWIAYSVEVPATVVGGAGVQLRSLLPRPGAGGQGLLLGREALVLNVYVEPEWRRRGIARALMHEVLCWAPGAGVVRLTLHASAEGRPLYESMGFAATNEMRFGGTLAPAGPWLGAEVRRP